MVSCVRDSDGVTVSCPCHVYAAKHPPWTINLAAELSYSTVVMYSEGQMVVRYGHSCRRFMGWSVPHIPCTCFVGHAFHSPCLQTAHCLNFLNDSQSWTACAVSYMLLLHESAPFAAVSLVPGFSDLLLLFSAPWPTNHPCFIEKTGKDNMVLEEDCVKKRHFAECQGNNYFFPLPSCPPYFKKGVPEGKEK